MTVTERMLNRIDELGKTQAELCRYLGIKTSIIAGWKKQNSIPPAWHLVGISEFLNISVDWLLTGKDNTIVKNSTHPWELSTSQKIVAETQFQNLVEEQVALINTFGKLNQAEKDEIWVLMQHMVERKQMAQQGLSSNSATTKDGSSESKTA